MRPAANFTVNELLEVFHDFESAKDKMLEIGSDLGIYNSPRCRKGTPIISYTKRQALCKLLLINFLQEVKYF